MRCNIFIDNEFFSREQIFENFLEKEEEAEKGRNILRQSKPELDVVARNQIIKNFALKSFRVRTLKKTITDYISKKI